MSPRTSPCCLGSTSRPAYILARAARGGRGNRSAWLCIIGFAAVVFNFTVVNVYFPGLHSYSRRT
ncbi:hypothetical protein BWQ92_00995 [Arthrobacter sp. QXT-31]|nr:hypothetical protein BWQ92_00995 [Arthrobacter sp. QXT-31]